MFYLIVICCETLTGLQGTHRLRVFSNAAVPLIWWIPVLPHLCIRTRKLRRPFQSASLSLIDPKVRGTMWLSHTNKAIAALVFKPMDIVSGVRCFHTLSGPVKRDPVHRPDTPKSHAGQSAASAGRSKCPAQHLWTSVEWPLIWSPHLFLHWHRYTVSELLDRINLGQSTQAYCQQTF